MLIILMRQNQKPNPAQQRTAYSENLESFANAIDEFITKFMKQGIEIMTQIKIYNEHLRKKMATGFYGSTEGLNLNIFAIKPSRKNFPEILIHLKKLIK